MQDTRSIVAGIEIPRGAIQWIRRQAIGMVALVIFAIAGATRAAVAQDRHADPELEALLPTVLGGVSLIVESQLGTQLGTDSAAFDAFLQGLGKTRADFSLASAYPAGGLEARVGAWRV